MNFLIFQLFIADPKSNSKADQSQKRPRTLISILTENNKNDLKLLLEDYNSRHNTRSLINGAYYFRGNYCVTCPTHTANNRVYSRPIPIAELDHGNIFLNVEKSIRSSTKTTLVSVHELKGNHNQVEYVRIIAHKTSANDKDFIALVKEIPFRKYKKLKKSLDKTVVLKNPSTKKVKNTTTKDVKKKP